MQQAFPVIEYSADERAERARGAAIAFLAIVFLGSGSLLAALATLLFSR